MRAAYNYDDGRALAHHHHILSNPNHFFFFFSFSFQFFIQFVVVQDHISLFSFFFFSIFLFNPWWVIATNSFLLFFPIFSFSFFFSIFSFNFAPHLSLSLMRHKQLANNINPLCAASLSLSHAAQTNPINPANPP